MAARGCLMMYVAMCSGGAQASLLSEAGARLLMSFRYGVSRLIRGPHPHIVEI
jgi:hypothetical protein